MGILVSPNQIASGLEIIQLMLREVLDAGLTVKLFGVLKHTFLNPTKSIAV